MNGVAPPSSGTDGGAVENTAFLRTYQTWKGSNVSSRFVFSATPTIF